MAQTKPKRKRQVDLNIFFLTQYLEPEYWDFSYLGDEAVNSFNQLLANKDAYSIGTNLVRMLNFINLDPKKDPAKKWEVEEAYLILHDKDTREVWDERVMSMVIETKRPHIHMAVKFKKGCNSGATLSRIAKLLGVESQYIEKAKSGRYAWDNSLAYLVHAKDKDKNQYSPDEVFTLAGKDYKSIYHESIERWERGAVKKENQQAVEDVDWLEHGILTGQVVKSQVLLTDEYYKIYAMNKRRIDDAFDTYGQRKMYRAMKDLEDGKFKTQVYYIMGKSGSGKTTFVNRLIHQMIVKSAENGEKPWTVCKTASTNPVDDYQGEEILFMDDVRGQAMRADDWLKLLDPWNISPSSARYKNKMVVARAIFITATMTPQEFFYYSKGVGSGQAQEEAVDQFLRRLAGIIQVINFDEIIVSRALKDGKNHTHEFLVSSKLNEHGYNEVKKLDSEIAIVEDENLKKSNTEDLIKHFVDEIVSD